MLGRVSRVRASTAQHLSCRLSYERSWRVTDMQVLAAVDDSGCHEPDAGVMMPVVVPIEKCAAVGTRLYDRAEAIGEIGSILERLEMRLRERIVIGDVRPAEALVHAEVVVELGHRLRGHGGIAIGVDRDWAGDDAFAPKGGLDSSAARTPSSRRASSQPTTHRLKRSTST